MIFGKDSYYQMGHLVANELSNFEMMIWWHLIGLFYATNKKPAIGTKFNMFQHGTASYVLDTESNPMRSQAWWSCIS